MAVLYDFRCPNEHVHAARVEPGTRLHECPTCGEDAKHVWLSTPKLDWTGMAQGPNAGPEFIARFEKSHKQRREQEEKHKAEHGDELRGAGA
jgi:hypothetical protein